MGRPPFTAPVERPADSAVRSGAVENVYDNSAISAGGSPTTQLISDAPENLELELVTISGTPYSGDVVFNMAVQETFGGTNLAILTGHLDSGPISLDPPVTIPEGGALVETTYNESSSEVQRRVSATYRTL